MPGIDDENLVGMPSNENGPDAPKWKYRTSSQRSQCKPHRFFVSVPGLPHEFLPGTRNVHSELLDNRLVPGILDEFDRRIKVSFLSSEALNPFGNRRGVGALIAGDFVLSNNSSASSVRLQKALPTPKVGPCSVVNVDVIPGLRPRLIEW